MVISSPCLIDNKELTSPEQTAPGSAGFHQVIDFLNRSHICYALTKKPDVYVSFIKQFWRSAEATTNENGEVQITATIDGHSMSITEASLRQQLKLDDQHGCFFTSMEVSSSPSISSLPLKKPKKTAWEQFSSNIATAVICLATNRKYNFSRMIFEHMVSNISSPHKFFMYPRFIQICLDMQRKQLQQHSRTYHVPSLSNKVFNNMKRPTKGYSGQEVALFPTMLDVTEPSTSPSRITSSPSPEPSPSPSPSPSPAPTQPSSKQPSPTQPSPTQPSPGAEHHFPTPHDSPLHAVHSHGSDEGSLKLNELMNLVTKLSDRIRVLEDDLRKTKKTYSSAFTKLILRVKKLESQIKTGKTRRKARIVHSDDEDIEDDSSKQGRKLSDAEVQEKARSSEKGSAEISTAGATKGTASEVPMVSTAEEDISTAGRTVTYSRRSEEQRTRKDKGKANIEESEPKEQMNEEQKAHIARDEEIARQWDEEERQRAMSEAKSTKKIDWNDPSVIRPIFEKVWDFNQHIETMEHGSEKMKSSEKIEEKDDDTQKEVKEVAKESGAKRKKSLPRKRRIVKRQVGRRCHEIGRLIRNGIAIHMLTEKKYPLSQEMISKMLKRKLEVDHESSQAFKLLSTNGVSTASTNLVLLELVNTARRKISTADGRSC
ncbi:hypothetical protein Tco_1575164 [Tanacetum coccineum]